MFEKYGATRDIWVARKPPGFAFVTFEDDRVSATRGTPQWRLRRMLVPR